MNQLYPIFLKPSKIHYLIVGAGFVGLEKLSFLLKSSPSASVTVVSETFLDEVLAFSKLYDVTCVESSYKKEFLQGKSIVIAATNVFDVNKQVYIDAKQINMLANVADTPDLCDFYLGGIVTKGDLKVAISTNGRSPTISKRLREFFENILPESTDDLIANINKYRRSIKGDLHNKVEKLNHLTKQLIEYDKG